MYLYTEVESIIFVRFGLYLMENIPGVYIHRSREHYICQIWYEVVMITNFSPIDNYNLSIIKNKIMYICMHVKSVNTLTNMYKRTHFCELLMLELSGFTCFLLLFFSLSALFNECQCY